MRAILFHNPTAGDGDHSREELLTLLRTRGIDPLYCSTRGDDFPDMLREPADLILIAGGDGTVAKVLTRVSHPPLRVGLLPLGTANNIAVSLGLSGDLARLTSDWEGSVVRPFNVGCASGPWGERRFVESVGFGALASATNKKSGKSSKISKSLIKGRETFRDCLKEAKPVEMTIEIDGEQQPGNWIAVEMMNVPATGPRLKLSEADPGDDMLDVVLIDEADRQDVLDWLNAPDDLPPPVPAIRGREIRFRWSGKPLLRIDDDTPDAPEDGDAEISVKLESHALSILARPWGAGVQEIGVEPLSEE